MKEGKGIMNNNNEILNYKIIYEGEFIKDKKEGFGILYFENENKFECNWRENIIDESKEGILYINNLIKIKKINLRNEWIKLIIKEINDFYGNMNIKLPNQSIIK